MGEKVILWEKAMRTFVLLCVLLVLTAPVSGRAGRDVTIEVKAFPGIYKATGIVILDVSESGKYVAGANEHGKVFILDTSTSKVSKPSLPNLAVSAVCFREGDRTLFVGEIDGNLTAYDTANDKVLGSVKVSEHVRRVMRLGTKHLLVLHGDTGSVIEANARAQMKVCSVGLSEVSGDFLCSSGLPGLLCKSGGVMVADNDARFTAPRFQFKLEPTETLRCVTVSQEDSKQAAYCTNDRVYSESEGRAGCRTSPHRLRSRPMAIYRWKTFWLVCGGQEITVLDDKLQLVTEHRLPKGLVLGSATTSSFAGSGDTAVLAVAHDWDVVVYIIKP